jgi:K+-transporting ATPase KdpF subunit
MNVMVWVSAAAAAGLFGYLVYALLRAEEF